MKKLILFLVLLCMISFSVQALSLDDSLLHYYSYDNVADNGVKNLIGSPQPTYSGTFYTALGGICNRAGDYQTSQGLITNMKMINQTTDFTFNMWIYFTTSANGERLVDFNDGSSAWRGQFWINSAGLLSYTTGSGAFDTGSTLISQSVWTMVTLKRSGASMYLYKNGVLINQNNGSFQTGQIIKQHFGMDKDYNDYSNSLYDETGYWNRSLTQSEITTLYNGGSCYNLTNIKTILSTLSAPTFNLPKEGYHYNAIPLNASCINSNISLYVDKKLNISYNLNYTNDTLIFSDKLYNITYSCCQGVLCINSTSINTYIDSTSPFITWLYPNGNNISLGRNNSLRINVSVSDDYLENINLTLRDYATNNILFSNSTMNITGSSYILRDYINFSRYLYSKVYFEVCADDSLTNSPNIKDKITVIEEDKKKVKEGNIDINLKDSNNNLLINTKLKDDKRNNIVGKYSIDFDGVHYKQTYIIPIDDKKDNKNLYVDIEIAGNNIIYHNEKRKHYTIDNKYYLHFDDIQESKDYYKNYVRVYFDSKISIVKDGYWILDPVIGGLNTQCANSSIITLYEIDAPIVVINSPLNNSITTNNYVYVNISVSDLSPVNAFYSINGINQTYTGTVQESLSNGVYTMYAYAIDSYNNVGYSPTIQFTVNYTAPPQPQAQGQIINNFECKVSTVTEILANAFMFVLCIVIIYGAKKFVRIDAINAISFLPMVYFGFSIIACFEVLGLCIITISGLGALFQLIANK